MIYCWVSCSKAGRLLWQQLQGTTNLRFSLLVRRTFQSFCMRLP